MSRPDEGGPSFRWGDGKDEAGVDYLPTLEPSGILAVMMNISRRAMALAAVLTLYSTTACAQQPSAADQVADQFLANGNPPTPSDPKLAKDLEFLNTCAAKRIRASDISYSDTQDAITAKVHDAMQKCNDELYGPTKRGSEAVPSFQLVQ